MKAKGRIKKEETLTRRGLRFDGEKTDEGKGGRQKNCGMRIAERKRPEARSYLQARLMRSETELKLSQYKIQ
jgi:hypothetical protein